MYDQYTTQTSSLGCATLDFFDSAFDFNDLAFLDMVLCMQESDKALAAKMSEIRDINKQKKAINDHIANLNSWLSLSKAKEADDSVYVEGGLDDTTNANDSSKVDLDNPEDPLRAAKKEVEDLEGLMAVSLANGNLIDLAKYSAQHATAKTKLDVLRRSSYSKKQVEKKIEELRGKLEDMNSSSSVMMIDLQRLMNKRNEASQLVSNIESKSNQTAMGIIANFK